MAIKKKKIIVDFTDNKFSFNKIVQNELKMQKHPSSHVVTKISSDEKIGIDDTMCFRLGDIKQSTLFPIILHPRM